MRVPSHIEHPSGNTTSPHPPALSTTLSLGMEGVGNATMGRDTHSDAGEAGVLASLQ